MNKRILLSLLASASLLILSGPSSAKNDKPCKNCPQKEHHYIGCQHPPKNLKGKLGARHHSCGSPVKNQEVSNETVEEEIINYGPEEEEMYRQEFPEYLPGESEVLRVEPGPDLSRTQPFENNPYK